MEVLRVYARASVYNEGLYAEMYPINLAAVSTRDYAFLGLIMLHTPVSCGNEIEGGFQVTQLGTH